MRIAFAGFKSSSGKTTTIVNLAAALMARGHTVKIWDCVGIQQDLTRDGQRAGLDVTRVRPIVLGSLIPTVQADFHLIECPPQQESAGEITTILTLCDRLVIPLECEFKMIEGMRDFGGTLQSALKSNPNLLWKVLVGKFKPRQKKHLNGFLKMDYPVFQTVIRDSSWVADAPAFQKSVLDYAPRSAAARAFKAVAKEVEEWH